MDGAGLMSTTAVALIAPTVAAVVAAATVGGVKWLRAVTAAVGKLTVVAETQAQTSEHLIELQRQLVAIARTCDERWHRLGGLIPHPRWADADDRPPRLDEAPA